MVRTASALLSFGLDKDAFPRFSVFHHVLYSTNHGTNVYNESLYLCLYCRVPRIDGIQTIQAKVENDLDHHRPCGALHGRSTIRELLGMV